MKVVIYFKKLNIGGAERSTVRLVNEFAKNGHDVVLLLHTKGGELDSEVDNSVRLIYLFNNPGLVHLNNIKNNLVSNPLKLVKGFFSFLIGCIRLVFFLVFPLKADLVLTGWQGYDPCFVNRVVKGKKHFQIIRSENAIVLNGEDQPFIGKYEKQLTKGYVDGYICVSEYIRKLMIERTNVSADSIFTIYNIINIHDSEPSIKPEEYSFCCDDDIIIVTVCRLVDGPKGLFRMVRVCKRITEKGFHIKWFVIGDGRDREAMQHYIEEHNIANRMYLCGFKKNPINYYKYADIVAVLSYAEGLCGAVNEAKLLCKPIIATRFSAIEEQIQHKKNGFIVENDEDAIVEGMELLLRDDELRESLAINGLPTKLLDNTYKIQQYVGLL